MRADNPPFRDYAADLDAIFGSKSKATQSRLKRLRSHILLLYCSYLSARAALETLPVRNWTPKSGDALRHCYSGKTKAWATIKGDLIKSIKPSPNRCPYCLLRQARSLDHFLPKDKFPEYAVFALNLVLICDPCNRQKGKDFVSAPRAVLNPYYDGIPTLDAMLHAVVTATATSVAVQFLIAAPIPNVPAPLLALARRHFETFSLDRELKAEGSTFVSTLVNQLAATRNAAMTLAELDAFLNARMLGFSDFPINSWELALLQALENNPGFLNYVNAKIALAPIPVIRPRPHRNAITEAAIAMAAVQRA